MLRTGERGDCCTHRRWCPRVVEEGVLAEGDGGAVLVFRQVAREHARKLHSPEQRGSERCDGGRIWPCEVERDTVPRKDDISIGRQLWMNGCTYTA